MALCAYVGQAQQGVRPELALNGKAIVFRMGKPVLVIKSRRAADGDQERPVDVVVGVAGRDVQRREWGRKPLARQGPARNAAVPYVIMLAYSVTKRKANLTLGKSPFIDS